MNIDKTCRELVTKLYTGDNAKYLVGEHKIPEYLTTFLANMHKQVHEFKLNSVRALRTAAEKLITLCQDIPSSVCFYLMNKYSTIINTAKFKVNDRFQRSAFDDKELKDRHL